MEVIIFFLLVLGFALVFCSWQRENTKNKLIAKQSNDKVKDENSSTTSYKHPYSIDAEYDANYEQEQH